MTFLARRRPWKAWHTSITFFSPLDVWLGDRYEAVRAVVVDGHSMADVAQHFALSVTYGTVRGFRLVSFRRHLAAGPCQPLSRRLDRGRPAVAADDSELAIAIADIEALSLEPGRRLSCLWHAGLFLFLPLLCQAWLRSTRRAGWLSGLDNGSRSQRFLMRLLVLKLLDKERRSHIDDFNCDEGVGDCLLVSIFCPRKALPPTSSYRTVREHQEKLLQGWVTKLSSFVPRGDSLFARLPCHWPSRRRPIWKTTTSHYARSNRSKRLDLLRDGAKKPRFAVPTPI